MFWNLLFTKHCVVQILTNRTGFQNWYPASIKQNGNLSQLTFSYWVLIVLLAEAVIKNVIFTFWRYFSWKKKGILKKCLHWKEKVKYFLISFSNFSLITSCLVGFGATALLYKISSLGLVAVFLGPKIQESMAESRRKLFEKWAILAKFKCVIGENNQKSSVNTA